MSFAFSRTGEGSESSGLLSEGILSELSERLRIQPGGEGDKHGDAESHGLRAGHDGVGRFAGLLEPGVHDDAEVMVKRGDDVEDGKYRENGMVRLDERKENEILAHEAGRWRDTSKRKHKDQQQDSSGGATLVKTIQVFQFFADNPFLTKHNDDRERAGGHKHIRQQIEGDAGKSSFVPGDETEQDVADVGDRRVSEQTLYICLGQRGEMAPGEGSHGEHREEGQTR